MVKDMLFSIIIPVFNVSINLLKRTIESAIGQSGDDTELIIVDDGSKAENSILYKNLCNGYAQTKYYAKENAGPSAARNYGVEKAQGDYVFFLDSDDYIVKGCIEQARLTINKYDPDIVFGYVYKDLADQGLIKYKISSNEPEAILVEDKKDLTALMNHILGYEEQSFTYEYGYISDGPWCRFFRRSLFENNYFDAVPKCKEDTLWNIELLNKCKTAVICKSRWYIYAVRNGSTMQGYRKDCYNEFLYITERVSDIGHELWNGEIDRGVAYRIWHDIFILSRALIFNRRNEVSFRDKYNMLKNAIETPSYQNAVKTVDFSREKRKSRKIIKEILNIAMKMKVYILVYITLKFYIAR